MFATKALVLSFLSLASLFLVGPLSVQPTPPTPPRTGIQIVF